MLKILVFRKKFTKTNDWSVGKQVDVYPYILYPRLRRCYCNYNYSTKTQSPSWNDWGSRFSNHNPCKCALSSLTNNKIPGELALIKTHTYIFNDSKKCCVWLQPHKIIQLLNKKTNILLSLLIHKLISSIFFYKPEEFSKSMTIIPANQIYC